MDNMQPNIIIIQPDVRRVGNDTYVNGYKLMTTFMQDFIIAEKFGIKAITDTYKRALAEWKNDYKYLTELVMVLNWRSFQNYKVNNVFSQLYAELYYAADEYACTHLKGDELEYYYDTTD